MKKFLVIAVAAATMLPMTSFAWQVQSGGRTYYCCSKSQTSPCTDDLSNTPCAQKMQGSINTGLTLTQTPVGSIKGQTYVTPVTNVTVAK